MGQFATPGELARDIVSETVRFLPADLTHLRVLEPSMGTGSFVSAAIASFPRVGIDIRGYELDPDFHAAAKDIWADFPVTPVRGDFTRTAAEPIFDLVLSNPPYVRHHAFDLAEKRRLQKRVFEVAGVRISGLAGLYCHFILLSKAWMRPNAVGVWLVPSEWMSVNYGSAIRNFLTEKVQTLRVHRFDTTDVRFSDALVSSCVIWFRNAVPNGSAVEFTFGADIHNPERRETIGLSELRAFSKWPPDMQRGKNACGWRLGDFFDIRRGVVTGDNRFFVLTEEESVKKRIPKRFLRPILPSPRHLKVDHVHADEDGLPIDAERRFLLDCTGYGKDDLPSSVREYLMSGEQTTAQKNLCASRNVWYEQEKRNPTRFLCSYMGRGREGDAPVRFILNDSRAIVSNSFLMMYPKCQLAELLSLNPSLAETVWHFLIGIPRHTIVSAGRSYGGGLQKVEPRELASVPCLELHEWMVENGANPYREERNGQMCFLT